MQTVDLEDPFIPEFMMMVFKRNSTYYIETAKMIQKDHEFIPGPMMPASDEFMKELSNSLSEEADTFSMNLLDHRILYVKSQGQRRTIIWSVKKDRPFLYFAEKIGLEDGHYPVPNLIFKLEGSELDVFAVIDNVITEKTILYRAPFGNIDDNGSVCMGNVKKGKRMDDINKTMEHWEKLFFNSTFTHTSTDKVVNGNLVTAMKDCQLHGVFYPELLIATKRTFKSICR